MFKWGVICFLGHEFIEVLPAFAGKETSITLTGFLKVVGDFWYIGPMLFGGAATLYSLKSRGFYEAKTAYLTRRNRTQELKWDTERSSSKLTEHGHTNPEDKL